MGYQQCLPLQTPFFSEDTVTVARQLLNGILCKVDARGLQAFRIVETEAYTEDDPACHAYQRKTGRAALFYQKPAMAYVYFVYGMHHCFNIITEPEGKAGAVLIRALAPVLLSDTETENPDYYCPPKDADPLKAPSGPARLCKALGITTANTNGSPLLLQSLLEKTHYKKSDHQPSSHPLGQKIPANTDSWQAQMAYLKTYYTALAKAAQRESLIKKHKANVPLPFGLFLACCDLPNPKTGLLLSPDMIVTTPRVGISKAKDFPWRFYIEGNPYVSGHLLKSV
ncbi:MAG: DNA-3-methyladenine glycosylase [Cyanobacteria bacterium P01_H01_bin.74]